MPKSKAEEGFKFFSFTLCNLSGVAITAQSANLSTPANSAQSETFKLYHVIVLYNCYDSVELNLNPI